MAKKPDLIDITSLTNSSSVNSLNQNWSAIETSFDNTLSLDGSTPNAMNADLDLNGNALLNVGVIDADNLTLNGQVVTDLASVPEWRSTWVTARAYAKNDLVKTNGNVYICLIAHTSGVFATDLTALRWELMVTKGDSGAGTGDLLSTNNLSELTNAATARANLGLGTAAIESTVPVAKGGTGGTTAAVARTNLGLVIGTNVQAYDSDLQEIANTTWVRGDIIRRSSTVLSRLPIGTSGQVLSSNGTDVYWADPTGGYTTASVVTLASTSTLLSAAIPSTANKIYISFRNMSTDGTGVPLIQVGAGTFLTTGYEGQAYMGTVGGVNSTQGIPLYSPVTAANSFDGTYVMTRQASDWFFIQGITSRPSAGFTMTVYGAIQVTGGINRVRLSGAGDSFDAGSGYISWE